MRIHFAESEYDSKLPVNFKVQYTGEIKKAYREVAKLLPFGFKHTNFFVQPRTYTLMEETGDSVARDYADYMAPWSKYPDNIADWVQEIIDKNDQFNGQDYRFKHADGRRWIAYKVGTYIVDQAIKNSGQSVIELSQLDCTEVLKLAKIDTRNYHGLAPSL